MSHDDKELELLLKPLRNLQPDSTLVNRWQNLAPSPGKKWKLALQLVAASLVGFLMGAAVFRTEAKPEDLMVSQISKKENLSSHATYEYSHVNLD